MTEKQDPERNEIKFLTQFADFSASYRVLEIGCGDGRLTWRYAREVRRVVGVEIEQDDLRLAIIDRPSDLENKVIFTNVDSIYLPFSKETFDLAILSWSL
ncbi:MAG TPA: class I SAM-dependent methyltransferase [Anaerolineales bacterium]|nr:class I SAM-dependent methyltransferase [Anaerolineales bacterium]